jgi:hypothetical protein
MRIHPRQLPALFTQAKAWTSTPKVMIRADDLDTLQNLQRKIDHAFGTKSVLVHDRAKGSRQYPHRFQSVRRAMRECSNAQFRLHQYKLMGCRQSGFHRSPIYDLHTNGRQLVQQIGRVVRTSPGRMRKQKAWVLAIDANAACIKATWDRCKSYEDYCAAETRNIVINETALPDRLLKYMPDN